MRTRSRSLRLDYLRRSGYQLFPDKTRSRMTVHLRVAIVGGGPVGLTVAIGLAQQGGTPSGRARQARLARHAWEVGGWDADLAQLRSGHHGPRHACAGRARHAQQGDVAGDAAVRGRRLLVASAARRRESGHAAKSPGLMGTRADIVLGMLRHIEAHAHEWSGTIELRFNARADD